MKAKEVITILTRNGWYLSRISGSHYQYKKAGNPYLATVPKHGGKDVSIGVLLCLKKGTGINELIP